MNKTQKIILSVYLVILGLTLVISMTNEDFLFFDFLVYGTPFALILFFVWKDKRKTGD